MRPGYPEELFCPFCGKRTPHVVTFDGTVTLQWCQTCYRVHAEAAPPCDEGELPRPGEL